MEDIILVSSKDKYLYVHRFPKDSNAHSACYVSLPGALFMVVNPLFFGYQQKSLRIFCLTQLHIDYSLATSFGPYLDHHQLL